jgi:4'-phosphopantetheinyl transferase
VAALAGVPGHDLGRVEVLNAATGAPYVLLDGEPAGMEVSITDRAGWAVCLVAADLGELGCDLELVEPRTPGFVADFLTAAERGYVESRPDADARYLAANLLWSAKESALKVLRTGLRRDTRTVEVSVPDVAPGADGWAPLSVRGAPGESFAGWWRRDGQFVFTVATRQERPPPVALESTTVLAAARPVHSWLERPLYP